MWSTSLKTDYQLSCTLNGRLTRTIILSVTHINQIITEINDRYEEPSLYLL